MIVVFTSRHRKSFLFRFQIPISFLDSHYLLFLSVYNRMLWYSLDYGLDDYGSNAQFPAEAANFSLHHRLQNGSGAIHPPMDTRGSFPGDEAAGA
jgi:hypothetical protein